MFRDDIPNDLNPDEMSKQGQNLGTSQPELHAISRVGR